MTNSYGPTPPSVTINSAEPRRLLSMAGRSPATSSSYATLGLVPVSCDFSSMGGWLSRAVRKVTVHVKPYPSWRRVTETLPGVPRASSAQAKSLADTSWASGWVVACLKVTVNVPPKSSLSAAVVIVCCSYPATPCTVVAARITASVPVSMLPPPTEPKVTPESTDTSICSTSYKLPRKDTVQRNPHSTGSRVTNTSPIVGTASRVWRRESACALKAMSPVVWPSKDSLNVPPMLLADAAVVNVCTSYIE